MASLADRPMLRAIDEESLATARASYRADGAMVLRNVIPPAWIDALREGTERLMVDPPEANEFSRADEGRFFGDSFCYLRVSEYHDFIFRSGIGQLAARLMGSQQVRFFYDQPLVKEPGTPKPTPWHQDSAYWPCSGRDVISIWVPLDAATPESGVVRYVKGSHEWNAYYPAENWSDRVDIGEERGPAATAGPGASAKQPRTLADIRDHPENYEFLSWNVEPGDVLIHQMETIHGAPGNLTQDRRRRAISFRFFGDDARWDETRPHFMRLIKRQSPDFPYPALQHGDPISDPLFPIIWPA